MGALTRIRFSDSLIELSDSLIGVSGRPTGETAEPEGTVRMYLPDIWQCVHLILPFPHPDICPPYPYHQLIINPHKCHTANAFLVLRPLLRDTP
jgi:hypothetical protein